MIQRIQTIYLFFVFCLMALVVYLPPFSSSWTVWGDSGIVAALALITIFLYKKRSLQIKISYVMLFLLILVYVLYFLFEWPKGTFADLFRNIRFTFVFPFIAIIFVYLAILGMKKDEKLIRSLDRIR